jgi:flagellar operon protein (TIGR03826 family)
MSLNVDNCPGCGRVYVKNSYKLCPNCFKDIELQYEKCLKYLRDNRTSMMTELSEATEVSTRQITKFIREGRISIKGNPNMGYDCEVCGTAIRENTMCEPCRSRLAKESKDLHEDETRKKIQDVQSGKIGFNIRDRLKDRH